MKINAWVLGLCLSAMGASAQNFNESKNLNAQHFDLKGKWSVGVRGSFNASTVSKFNFLPNIIPSFKLASSGGAAIFAELPITERFSFQPELVFNQKGFMIDQGINTAGTFGGINIPLDARVKVKTYYMEVPLLAKIHFGDVNRAHGYFMVGPSIGYLADAGMRVRLLNLFAFNTGFPKSVFKQFECSGVAALGFEAPVSPRIKFFTEGRFQQGFTRILNTGWVKLPVRNESFGVGMGLKVAI